MLAAHIMENIAKWHLIATIFQFTQYKEENKNTNEEKTITAAVKLLPTLFSCTCKFKSLRNSLREY